MLICDVFYVPYMTMNAYIMNLCTSWTFIIIFFVYIQVPVFYDAVVVIFNGMEKLLFQ